MNPLQSKAIGALAALLPVLVGCGSTQTGTVEPTTPFTEQHAEVFEDGADFIADPGKLAGAWSEQWREDLEQRVRLADAVVRITVRTVRTDIGPDGATTYRLIAQVDDTMLGKVPGGPLELMVRQGQRGYETIRGNDSRLLDGRFVAFLKWYRAKSGKVKPHWHLSPASEAVTKRVQGAIERRRRGEKGGGEGRRRVIIREN